MSRQIREGELALDDRHVMWWCEAGAADGEPVVMLHAGPGGRSNPALRSIFDEQRWRVIQFDQRGCGRSRPLGDVVDNTTQHLVSDLEALRLRLGLERWTLFGQSWGTALALAYAQAHPERVKALFLSAVYLGDAEDVRWFFEGPKALVPEAHAALSKHLPEAERHDLLSAYYRRVFDPDPAVHIPAARAFMEYDLWLIPLFPDTQRSPNDRSDEDVLAFARTFLHYLQQVFFLGDKVLLGNIGRIAHLPCCIVMGRYDIAVSMRPAWALRKAWPGSRLRIVPTAAYSPYQEAMHGALAEEAAALLTELPSP